MEDKRENQAPHKVRIHIDQKSYESPNPTTGAALYKLGNVATGLELYREVTGDKEDEPIKDGPEKVHLIQDDHFHSSLPHNHVIEYEVNGEPQSTTVRKLTPIQIMDKAGIDPAKNYLIRLNGSHQESYKDTPDKIIRMHDKMKFITNFIGPKPVSYYGSR